MDGDDYSRGLGSQVEPGLKPGLPSMAECPWAADGPALRLSFLVCSLSVRIGVRGSSAYSG